jgi:hypothetical protein
MTKDAAKKTGKRGADNVRDLLAALKVKSPQTEDELSASTSLDRGQVKKYTDYLSKKGLIRINKRLFKASTIELMNPSHMLPKAAEGKKQVVNQALKASSGKEGMRRVSAEDEDDLREISESLMDDFIGVMRLSVHGKYEASAALLLDGGDIVAATYEGAGDVLSGDCGISATVERFSGTEGGLEIYEMSREMFNESMRENVECVLKKAMPVADLNIRIKLGHDASSGGGLSHWRSSGKNKFGGFFSGRLEDSIRLSEFARKSITIQKKQDDVWERKGDGLFETGKGSKPHAIERKTNAEVEKNKKQEKKTGQEMVKRPGYGEKVETTIDRFYAMVKKDGRVRINDVLALKMKVDRAKLEQWALILEEHGLLKLNYPTLGEPEAVFESKEVK